MAAFRVMVPAVVLVTVRPPVPVSVLLTVMLALFWSRMPSAEPKSTVPPLMVRVLLPIDRMAPLVTPRVKLFWVIVMSAPAVVPAKRIASTTLLAVRVSLAVRRTVSVGPAVASEVL